MSECGTATRAVTLGLRGTIFLKLPGGVSAYVNRLLLSPCGQRKYGLLQTFLSEKGGK